MKSKEYPDVPKMPDSFIDRIIDKKIHASNNLEKVLNFSNYLVIAVPSKSIISILKEIKNIKDSDNYFFINATK